MNLIARVTAQSANPPALNPCLTLACVRACVPDGEPIREALLRAFLPEIDAVLAEVQRAHDRRFEDLEVAA